MESSAPNAAGADEAPHNKDDTSQAEQHIDIKLFVGRLPTTITEETVRPIFSEFGTVTEVVVIRDKTTGAHKGSAFVRMASIREADAAIRSLSKPRAGDAALGGLQISYAVGEPERLGFSPGALIAGEDEAKIFIGSLPRDVTEADILHFFSSYGKCHDPYLMRDAASKRFKGCGFLKFEQKEEALLAIRALRGIATFPGASRPLEIRIAEPKRTGATTSATTNTGNSNNTVGPTGNRLTSSSSHGGAPRNGTTMSQQRPTVDPTYQRNVNTTNNQGLFLQPQQYHHEENSQQLQDTQQPQQQTISALNTKPRTIGPWIEYYTTSGRPYYYNCHTLLTQWDVPKEFAQASSPQSSATTMPAAVPTTNKLHRDSEPTGPPGANIFVFHVPTDWSKEDLAAHFLPFGHIVSAMVAIDHATQRNKGYGFVSFTNVRSALQAVQEMNMLFVGNKRLRVAIKNGEIEHARRYAKEHAIPYCPDQQQQEQGGASSVRSPVTTGGNSEGGDGTNANTLTSGVVAPSVSSSPPTLAYGSSSLSLQQQQLQQRQEQQQPFAQQHFQHHHQRLLLPEQHQYQFHHQQQQSQRPLQHSQHQPQQQQHLQPLLAQHPQHQQQQLHLVAQQPLHHQQLQQRFAEMTAGFHGGVTASGFRYGAYPPLQHTMPYGNGLHHQQSPFGQY